MKIIAVQPMSYQQLNTIIDIELYILSNFDMKLRTLTL